MDDIRNDPTLEQLAYPKMESLLFDNGLQITLKTLIDAMETMEQTRGKTMQSMMVLEGLRGLYHGYVRRYELDDVE